MRRLKNAFAALMGRPLCGGLPPVRLLEIGPDDKLLLECESHMTAEQIRHLNEYMTAWLNGENRAAVLVGGLRLVAVRKAPTKAE